MGAALLALIGVGAIAPARTPVAEEGPTYLDQREPVERQLAEGSAIAARSARLQIGERAFSRGLVMAPPASVTYRLDTDHQAFAATVGVVAETPRSASVQFEVRLDGRRVRRTTVMRHGEKPAELYVPLDGAKRLTLVVHPADRGRDGDRGVWANARLTNEAKPEEGDRRVAPDTSVQKKLFFETSIAGEKDRRPYLLSLPRSGEAMRDEARREGRRWPMLVFLHGIVEGGDDHENLFIEAIPRYLRDRPGYAHRHRYIFLCPSAPWKTRFRREDVSKFVVDLVEHVAESYPVDKRRIYLTGLSDGAIGVWHIAAERPDLFAAIAPVAGRDGPVDRIAAALAETPAWMIVGARDGKRVLDAIDMARAYARAGAPFNLRIVPHRRHVIWKTAYLDDDLYDWLNQWRNGGDRVEPHFMPPGARASGKAQAAALNLLERAMRHQYAGEPIAMARALRMLTTRYPETIAARVGRRQRAAMDRDAELADRLKEAADESAAAQMLVNALEHRRAGRPEDADRLLRQVIDTWPLTDAADQARRTLNETAATEEGGAR